MFEYLVKDFDIEDLDAYLGVWVDYENDKTFAYFKYDNKFIEFEYDFVASRATTILNDVIQYLRGNQYIEKTSKKVLK